MGGKSDSNSSEYSWQNQVTNPWSGQQDYILNAFKRAEGAYNDTMNRGAWKGDYYAAPNQNQYDAFNDAIGFAKGQGRNINNNLFNMSGNWMNSGNSYMQNALAGLKDFTGKDQTDNILADARKYADDPYISNAVQASMRDAYTSAAENDIPNLYRSAAGAGGLNSDRAALAQGVVERGLGQRTMDLSSKMRENAWNTGIGATLNANGQRLQGWNQMGSLGSNMAQMGLAGTQAGMQNQGMLSRMWSQGAAGINALDQQKLDNERTKFESQRDFPWQALANYYNIIGNKSWGSNSSSYGMNFKNQQQSQDSGIGGILGQILGGAGTLGKMFSGGGGIFSSLKDWFK